MIKWLWLFFLISELLSMFLLSTLGFTAFAKRLILNAAVEVSVLSFVLVFLSLLDVASGTGSCFSLSGFSARPTRGT